MTRRTRPAIREAIYAAIKAQPGLTTAELQLALGNRISPQQLARHTSALAVGGQITATRAVTGEQGITLKYQAVPQSGESATC